MPIDDLIDELAGELRPVRPRRALGGSLLALAGWGAGAAGLLWLFDLMHGAMAPLPMLSFWLIAALAFAATWSALRMGSPGVGRDYGGWRWAGIAALALPLSALAIGLGDTRAAMDAVHPGHGLDCTIKGLVAGLGVGAALFFWLKRGAPTSPTRAGWVVGFAAGAAGATILALHCADDGMIHIALWHGLVVLLSGLAGRLALPPLLRW